MSSTGRAYFSISVLAIGLCAASWTVRADAWQTPGSGESTRHDTFGGIWSFNREESQIPDKGNTPRGDDGRPEGKAPPPGGDGPPGGFGGGRRGGGGFGGGGGVGGPGGSGSRGTVGNPEEMQATANYLSSLMEPTKRLTIVVRQMSVALTDADGRTVTLQTNNKSIDERAENGLVKRKRKAKWDGAVLVSEIDIDNGPKVERRYELFQEGEQLRVSTTLAGGFGGRGGGRGAPPVLHVYDRQRPQ